MAAEQIMTQALMQAAIEAAKAAIMKVRDVENPVNNVRSIHTTPRLGDSVLDSEYLIGKLQTSIRDCAISKQGKNIFMTNNYNKQESERVPVI